ncbi:MAG: hypothetical protein DRJ69_05190 [Thermoprotei archaeon]|nr:MAG: hypothetical protein DRJ69_05190 [Thermoprotei archaeon]
MLTLERCPTGIEGFDEITKGGFVRGTLVLLAGNPGTGKSTFAAKFLHEGAMRYGEPGVYISFVEPKDRFYSYMKNLGMDLEGAERRGLFKYLNLPTVVTKEVLGSIVEAMVKAVDEVKAKRVVIDSLTPFIQLGAPAEVRATLHNALMNLANFLKATTLIIADLPFGETKIGYGDEEFVVDAVIMLKLEYVEGAMPRRYLELVKIRGVPVTNVIYEYSIQPGEGFVLYPPLRPPRRATPLAVTEGKVDIRERVSTGIKGFDALLGGGIIKNANTLIVGPSGSGKTMLALTMAAENALKGLKVHYATFDEPLPQVMTTLKLLGYDPDELMRRGFTAASVPPQESSPGLLRSMMTRVFIKRGLGRDLVVVDGISALKRVFGERVFLRIMEEAMSFFKSYGMTSVCCLAEDYFKERGATLGTMVDNVIALTLNMESGELKRCLAIVKARMGAVDPRKHEVILLEGKPAIKT